SGLLGRNRWRPGADFPRGQRKQPGAEARQRQREQHEGVVAGAEREPLLSAMAEPRLRAGLARLAGRARRFGSVCTGAFILAGCGLLDGHRVATHWDACSALAEAFPAIDVDTESLYVVDEPVWTSAGVTAGIDMALADRKSTRLNSSHAKTSYAVSCVKKKEPRASSAL